MIFHWLRRTRVSRLGHLVSREEVADFLDILGHRVPLPLRQRSSDAENAFGRCTERKQVFAKKLDVIGGRAEHENAARLCTSDCGLEGLDGYFIWGSLPFTGIGAHVDT